MGDGGIQYIVYVRVPVPRIDLKCILTQLHNIFVELSLGQQIQIWNAKFEFSQNCNDQDVI